MRRFTRNILISLVSVITVITFGFNALAAEPHENPDTAEVIFSGISLYNYYSHTLDFVLNMDRDGVAERLDKMPFANIPEEIGEPVDIFTDCVMDITDNILSIDNDFTVFRTLLQQSRLKDVVVLVAYISADISKTMILVDMAEESVIDSGESLGVSTAPESSMLRQKYDEVLEKLEKIRELLRLYDLLLRDILSGYLDTEVDLEELLESLVTYQEEYLDNQVISQDEYLEFIEEILVDILINPLLPTDITLEIEPVQAYTGDFVTFRGTLSSKGQPMPGREVAVLINGSRYSSVITDSLGNYTGKLQVPYIYVPWLKIQSLYVPQRNDEGVYLAALSPEIILEVLFYETELDVMVEDTAYPGLETTVIGEFDYGQNPVPDEREVEIYLDDVLVGELISGKEFTTEIQISPDIETGEHSLLVSVKSKGRYAPVIVESVLRISKLTPTLEIDVPGLDIMPGNVEFSGRVYSKFGPVGNALVRIVLGNKVVQPVTSEDGTFISEIGTGMNFGIIGSQDMVIQVIPDAPWYRESETTRSIVLLNIITLLILVIILIVVIVYLPARVKRIKRKLSEYRERRGRIVEPEIIPERIPEYTVVMTAPPESTKKDEIPSEPRDRILHWYRIVLGTIQKITGNVLRPQQTLREYIRGKSGIPGRLTGYLMQFTVLAEKLLYSRYSPTPVDLDNSEKLFRELGDESKIKSVEAGAVPESTDRSDHGEGASE